MKPITLIEVAIVILVCAICIVWDERHTPKGG
jgi:hypothetical protein